MAAVGIPSGKTAGSPRLSIIVPAYNVETYLAECLDSVLGQPFADFEAIIVDDGSTDTTAEITRSYAAREPRIRLHQQPNAGLGAARNAGVRLARGDLLAFVDSDDWLAPDAYTPMVQALDHSGSDFAVGALKRDTGRVTRRMRDNHARDRLAIRIEDQPTMLADVFVGNKVFRRSFWERARLSFPERTSYEDQVALTEAFLAARSFDVLRHHVCVWRIRGDRSSISQQRHDINDLRDRIATKRLSTAMIHERASPAVQRVWHLGVLPVDMVEYFRHVPGCSPAYWQLLGDATAEFWDDAGYSFADVEVPVQQRLMGWLVAHDRRDELEALVHFVFGRPADSLPVELVGDRVRCLLPGADGPDSGIPPKLFEFSPFELRWEARLLDVEWAVGAVVLRGFALVRNVPSGLHRATLTMTATANTGARVDIEVENRNDPRATAWVRHSGHNYDGYGFRATVPLAVLVDRISSPDSTGASSWRFELCRSVGDFARSGSFTSWLPRIIDSGWRHVGSSHEAQLKVHGSELHLQVRRTARSPQRGEVLSPYAAQSWATG